MKKFIRRILMATLIMVVAVALVGLLEHYRRKIGLAEYKAELVKQGAEFDLAKLAPATPPPEQNAALVLGELVGRLQTNPLPRIELVWPMKMTEPGRARIEWQQPQPDQTVQTSTWEAAANTIAVNESVLSEIRTALKRPRFSDGLDYQKYFSLDFAPLLKLRDLRLWIDLSALVKLRQKDTTAAIENIEALQDLARGQRQELLLIYQVMAYAVEQSALTTTWELLQADQIKDEDLARLQAGWLSPQKELFLVQAMDMELARDTKLMTEARSSAKRYQEANTMMGVVNEAAAEVDREMAENRWFDSIGKNVRSANRYLKMKRWQYYGSYAAERTYLEMSKNVSAALNRLQTNQPATVVMPEFEKRHTQIVPDPDLLDATLKVTESFLRKRPGNYVRNEAARRLVGVAIALKRYQLKHREWPQTLEALVPEFLAAIPIDPADGQPLRYARKPNNDFLLYALGENLVDDGGDSTHEESGQPPYFLRGKDMVWPMPMREGP